MAGKEQYKNIKVGVPEELNNKFTTIKGVVNQINVFVMPGGIFIGGTAQEVTSVYKGSAVNSKNLVVNVIRKEKGIYDIDMMPRSTEIMVKKTHPKKGQEGISSVKAGK